MTSAVIDFGACRSLRDLRSTLALAEGQDIDALRNPFRFGLVAVVELRLQALYRGLLFAVIDGDTQRRNGIRGRIEALEAAPSDPRIERAQSPAALLDFLSSISHNFD